MRLHFGMARICGHRYIITGYVHTSELNSWKWTILRIVLGLNQYHKKYVQNYMCLIIVDTCTEPSWARFGNYWTGDSHRGGEEYIRYCLVRSVHIHGFKHLK